MRNKRIVIFEPLDLLLLCMFPPMGSTLKEHAKRVYISVKVRRRTLTVMFFPLVIFVAKY